MRTCSIYTPALVSFNKISFYFQTQIFLRLFFNLHHHRPRPRRLGALGHAVLSLSLSLRLCETLLSLSLSLLAQKRVEPPAAMPTESPLDVVQSGGGL